MYTYPNPTKTASNLTGLASFRNKENYQANLKLSNNLGLNSILACQLGTLKEADCTPSDQALRTVINRIQLQNNNLLFGWIGNDQFIYKNEQSPIQVFAHFLHPDSNLLIVIKGLSSLHEIENKEARIGIDIQSINWLHR